MKIDAFPYMVQFDRLFECSLTPLLKFPFLRLYTACVFNVMRLAFFLEYPLASRGGVSVLVEALIEALSPDFDIVLVSPDSEADLVTNPIGRLLQHHVHWPSPPEAPNERFRLAANCVLEEVAALEVDVCHFHCGGIFGWGNRWPNCAMTLRLKRKGFPCLWTNHLVVDFLHGYCGAKKPIWFKLAMLPMAWIGKLQQISSVQREICVSDHDVEKVRRWYFPVRRKVCRIYHSRLEEDSEIDHPSSDEAMHLPVILSVGHIAFRKGQHVLAEAFSRIAGNFPEWDLWMAGEIVEKECADMIQSTAARSGLKDRIRLLGVRNDVSGLMEKAGLFVQPSLQEALGLALQEALWIGCVCIGTNVGGIPELIKDGENGVLVKPGDPIALAAAIESLLKDGKTRRRLGAAGRPSVVGKEMTRAGMVESHLELYRRVLSKRIKSSP